MRTIAYSPAKHKKQANRRTRTSYCEKEEPVCPSVCQLSPFGCPLDYVPIFVRSLFFFGSNIGNWFSHVFRFLFARHFLTRMIRACRRRVSTASTAQHNTGSTAQSALHKAAKQVRADQSATT